MLLVNWERKCKMDMPALSDIDPNTHINKCIYMLYICTYILHINLYE